MEYSQLQWCAMLTLHLTTKKLQPSSLLMDYKSLFLIQTHRLQFYMLASSYLLNAMNRFGMLCSQNFSCGCRQNIVRK